jgi:uncharacterized protein
MAERITEQEAINILRSHIKDKDVFKKILSHSKRVQRIALKLGKMANADLDFIRTAALLHDIGRSKYPPGTKNSFRHGVYGASILRKLGLEKHAKVAERHLGVGITKRDIIELKLDLPLKCYIPRTKEELIITYADNLDHKGKIRSEAYVEERYRRELGDKVYRKVLKFHKRIHKLLT